MNLRSRPAEPRSAGSIAVRRLRPALGTLIAIEACATTEHHALEALEAAFTACLAIGQRLHPWTTDSDIHKINAAPPGRAIEVAPDTLELLRLATELHRLSGGIFDPCRPSSPGCMSDVRIDGSRVCCERPVCLDPGGFAKGLAIDRAIDTLIAYGCHAGTVNAGGDLRVFGRPDDPVLVRGPQEQMRAIALRDAALAVSNLDNQRRPREHAGYYVRTRAAHDTGRRFAAVTAPQAVVADALTKVVLLAPLEVTTAVLAHYAAQQVCWTDEPQPTTNG